MEQVGIKTMKICNKCGKEKPATLEFFYRRSASRDGLQSQCKACNGKYYEANRERAREYQHRYYEANSERKIRYSRRYREANPEKVTECNRKWREAHPEKAPEYCRKYREANPEKVREWDRKRRREVGCRVSRSISHGIWKSLRDGKAGRHWEDLVGYTLEDLKAHLEAQFITGMTWKNYGRAWHIDHIRPTSDFNFATAEDPDFKVCWSLWNLRPLWAKRNRKKGNRCEAPPLPLTHPEAS